MESNEELVQKTKIFVADLLAGVNVDDSIQNIIKHIVKEVAQFTHSDRVCIYEAAKEQDCINRVYQFRTDDSVAEDEKLQMISKRGLDEWIETLKSNKIVFVENRESVRDDMSTEYERMTYQRIDTFVIIPLYTKDRLPACMTLTNPDLSTFALVESAWLYLGQEMGLFYHRDRIDHEYLMLTEGIRSSNLSEFIVDYKSKRYQAFRITRVLSNVIPAEGKWDWIIQFYASIIKPEYREEFLRKTNKEYLEKFLNSENSSFSIDLEREVDGKNTWFRLEFSVVSLDEKGNLERFVVLVKDITQMKKEEEEQQQVIIALSSIYQVTFMIDVVQRITKTIKHCSPIEQSYPNGKIPNKLFLDTFVNKMVDDEYKEIVYDFMNFDTMAQRMKDTNALFCEYHGKQIEWGRIVLTPAKWGKDGSLEKVVFAIQDISEQKNRQEWVKYKLEHDELTQALNRTAFNKVTKMIEQSDIPIAFVLMDIDNFKMINDTYGHDIGDEALSCLVSVINEKMRAGDKIFRLGGDEFAVIMERVNMTQIDIVKNCIEQINETTMTGINGLPQFTVSAGITLSESGYDEAVYQKADKALYRTKKTTHMGYTVFEEM